nr:DUF805 domain-containing protein [uncultured Sphingomonas sp.]
MPTDWYTPRSLFNFSWRASRREYFAIQILGAFVIYLPLLFIMSFDAGPGPDGQRGVVPLLPLLVIAVLYLSLWIAAFVVMLAVAVRRMHDQEKSGWFLLLGFIPLIGWIFSLIFIFTPGDEEENLYGPNPRHAPRPGKAHADDLERVFD